MHTAVRTYYKALILLVVFSSNTLISFACSYSNLFHSSHHHTTPAKKKHQHSDSHHEHDHSANHHDESNKTESNESCCSTSVVALHKAEKAISRYIDAPIAPFVNHFIFGFVISYIDIFHLHPKDTLSIHENRWRAPTTIQDLRIVIQSFQI